MSELKAIRGGDIHDDVEFVYDDEDRASVLYYLKSEADKVIADLEESHKMEVEQLLIEIVELKKQVHDYAQGLYVIQAMADKEARHSNYKRCLAMAMWCGSAYDKWMMKKAKAISLGKEGVEYYRQARWKVSHYMRWLNLWFKIAEQFNEAK